MITKALPSKAATATKAKSVAEYVTWQINLCGKPQIQIAKEVGFEKPNVITMIKQGKTKVPINKISSMAKALEVDPVFFLKMCMQEYMPDLLDAVTTITNQPIVTANEMEFIEAIRGANPNDPKLSSKADRAALRAFITKLSSKSN